MKPEMPVAADLRTDGDFFRGASGRERTPDGFEREGMPRTKFHDAAIKVLRKVDFYARRLYDDEFSWFSGEYEIIQRHAARRPRDDFEDRDADRRPGDGHRPALPQAPGRSARLLRGC